MEIPMPDFQTIIAFLTGTGGVIAVLIYFMRQGQKGEWLFKSVHLAVVESYKLIIVQLELRLKEKDLLIEQAVKNQQTERERGDKWQALYLQSRSIADQSTILAATAVNSTANANAGGT